MKYNKEDYLIALTINILEYFDPLLLAPTEVLRTDDNNAKASFVIDGNVILINARRLGDNSIEYNLDIIFRNKEHVRLKDYKCKYAIKLENSHSRAFDLKPTILHELSKLARSLLER